MQLLARFIALLAVAMTVFAANAFAQESWAGMLFPRVVPRPCAEMVSAALVGAAASAAVSALPFVLLFKKSDWEASLVVAPPVVALRSPEISATMTETAQPVSIMAWVEVLSYSLAVVLAAWLPSRRRHRSANAL